MKYSIAKVFFFSVILTVFGACASDELTPYYDQRTQEPGKVVIQGYNAMIDSVQIAVNGKIVEIGKGKNNTAFVKKIEKNYEFVFFENEVKTFVITNKRTKVILGTYQFTTQEPNSSLYFYVKEDLWLDSAEFLKPGTLSQSGYAGFKFIFPSVNKYSAAGYTGSLDGIITKNNGQLLGVAENINKSTPGSFIEFPYSTPTGIKMELVKHGTTESYIPGKKVIVSLTMTNNKSKYIVLEEKQDLNGAFSGVEGVINLADYFSFN
jgi:hypothetical protein